MIGMDVKDQIIEELRQIIEQLRREIEELKLLDRSRRMFSAWHRRDEMTEEGFHRSMLMHRNRFLELVNQPPDTKDTANLAARFTTVEYLPAGGGELGQRYHERMWTAIATCVKQDRSFFEFLHSSIAAHLTNQPALSLLGG